MEAGQSAEYAESKIQPMEMTMRKAENSTRVRTSQEGQVGWIILDQPDALNPLCEEMIAACRQALRQFESDGLAVVVLTGTGRAFCAGADLNWLESVLSESVTDSTIAHAKMTAILDAGHTFIQELKAYPGVVVSLVNGPAVGGGVGLALAADIVVASKSAFFSLPFVPKLGLVPDLGALAFFQRRIGSAKTVALSLLGEKLTAEDAVEAGLIWSWVQDEQLQAFATDLGERLAALPRSAVIELKRLLACAESQPLDAFLAEERVAQAELFAGLDARTYIIGFLDLHRSTRGK